MTSCRHTEMMVVRKQEGLDEGWLTRERCRDGAGERVKNICHISFFGNISVGDVAFQVGRGFTAHPTYSCASHPESMKNSPSTR